jgi:hypothetical protein
VLGGLQAALCAVSLVGNLHSLPAPDFEWYALAAWQILNWPVPILCLGLAASLVVLRAAHLERHLRGRWYGVYALMVVAVIGLLAACFVILELSHGSTFFSIGERDERFRDATASDMALFLLSQPVFVVFLARAVSPGVKVVGAG